MYAEGALCRSLNGSANNAGSRICQPTSRPGQNAPPEQLSSAALSRPCGVIAASTGGASNVSGGPADPMNAPLAHAARIAYWVTVNDNRHRLVCHLFL